MNFDQLGVFYLGTRVDPAGGESTGEPLLYDAKDLTTHALCVGMTGSGKTGLGIGLLEEAALDGIPAIAIDPKGDLANLALTFPDLRPADFEPWLDDGAAERAGKTKGALAEETAEQFREGLRRSGQGPERIRAFADAVDISIYTPGSTAGLPLSPLQSLSAPAPAIRDDRDAFADRVLGTVSGVLALVGLEADPVSSPEHVVLSTLVSEAWKRAESLSFEALVRLVADPPISHIGVMDLDSFFPQKARQALAMRLNAVLASPSFAAFREGEALDVQKLLYGPDGRPRLSIVNIAHLSDTERMAFVTLLLEEVVSWVRTQPGTSSLRALLYMDEVFGFFPPVAEPPSKRPMLTLLKQARAYGLGVVLSTQNPVDLDYKGLSNCGTWFLGRLQAERDVKRVLDGLEGASQSGGRAFDRQRMAPLLAGLESRTFLLHDVHEDEPALFRTRWCLSYLAGPMTRDQLRRLPRDKTNRGDPADPAGGADAPGGGEPGAAAGTPASSPGTGAAADDDPRGGGPRPSLPREVFEVFVRSEIDRPVLYRPGLLASAKLHYTHRYSATDTWKEHTAVVFLVPDHPARTWDDVLLVDAADVVLDDAPRPESRYLAPPEHVTTEKKLDRLRKSLAARLYEAEPLVVYYCKEHKLWSRIDEERGAFVARAQLAEREARDQALAQVRAKYGQRLERLQGRIRRAEERIAREEAQYEKKKVDTAVSLGSAFLGAILGRRTIGRATTAARGAGRAYGERADIKKAQHDRKVLLLELTELENELEDALDDMRRTPVEVAVEDRPLRPKKADTQVRGLSLAWLPWVVDEGRLRPAFRLTAKAP